MSQTDKNSALKKPDDTNVSDVGPQEINRHLPALDIKTALLQEPFLLLKIIYLTSVSIV